MTMVFDEVTHTYVLDGKFLPSVTQILSIADLYSRVDKNLMARASKFGNAVHRATELHDAGTLDMATMNVALAPYLDGWKRFLTETGFTGLKSETVVYSANHGYAGRFDRLGVMTGKLTLLDIKTTTTVPKTTKLQLAAYANAYEEMHDNKIEQRISVQLKPCAYSIRPYNDPLDFLIFRNFITVYQWRNNV